MRSDAVFKGTQQAPHRSLFNALGLTEEEMNRPLIGIVSSYNEIVPGHMNIDKLVEAVKLGVAMAGGTPRVFPAIAVCDGIAMGHTGMKYSLVTRDLIADSTECMALAHQFDEQLAISRQTEEAWKETVASTRALMNAGMANESAVSQMEATYYQVQGSVLDLRKQINQAENSLALLLAETPRHYERGSLAQQQFPTDFSVGIPVQMLSGRPDVRSAERSLEAAFYGTNKARSAFYPSITLSGSAGWTNSAGVMILNPGKFLASAVGSLTQPLFNRGQVVAQYRIARAQQEEAALGFQQTLLNAGSEVNDALTAYQTSQGKKLLLDKQVASLQTALRSTSLLMEHGNTTYLEVLTARQTLLSAQLSQTANHFTEIQSLINLFQALGGGQN